jgi:hypothetical protein
LNDEELMLRASNMDIHKLTYGDIIKNLSMKISD